MVGTTGQPVQACPWQHDISRGWGSQSTPLPKPTLDVQGKDRERALSAPVKQSFTE